MDPLPSTTCWTMIRGAARGDAAARDDFARRYAAVIEAYLETRWRLAPRLRAEVADARQEVLVECLKEDGVLERADPGRGFRGFLHGVVRNVAARVEERHRRHRAARVGSSWEEVIPDDRQPEADVVFDRAWARLVMDQAGEVMARRAVRLGAPARRRVELLRLRFREGVPLREIAPRLGVSCARIHKDYEKARNEFRAALGEVVAFHLPEAPEDREAECVRLLDLLR